MSEPFLAIHSDQGTVECIQRSGIQNCTWYGDRGVLVIRGERFHCSKRFASLNACMRWLRANSIPVAFAKDPESVGEAEEREGTRDDAAPAV